MNAPWVSCSNSCGRIEYYDRFDERDAIGKYPGEIIIGTSPPL
jgi:hypothetical protein